MRSMCIQRSQVMFDSDTEGNVFRCFEGHDLQTQVDNTHQSHFLQNISDGICEQKIETKQNSDSKFKLLLLKVKKYIYLRVSRFLWFWQIIIINLRCKKHIFFIYCQHQSFLDKCWHASKYLIMIGRLASWQESLRHLN